MYDGCEWEQAEGRGAKKGKEAMDAMVGWL